MECGHGKIMEMFWEIILFIATNVARHENPYSTSDELMS